MANFTSEDDLKSNAAPRRVNPVIRPPSPGAGLVPAGAKVSSGPDFRVTGNYFRQPPPSRTYYGADASYDGAVQPGKNVVPRPNPWAGNGPNATLRGVGKTLAKTGSNLITKPLAVLGAADSAADLLTGGSAGVDDYIRRRAERGDPAAINAAKSGPSNYINKARGAIGDAISGVFSPASQEEGGAPLDPAKLGGYAGDTQRLPSDIRPIRLPSPEQMGDDAQATLGGDKLKTSDAGLLYSQDENGVISIGSGPRHGTLDFGSKEANDRMAAKFQDGKGTFSTASLPDLPRRPGPAPAPAQYARSFQPPPDYSGAIAATLRQMQQATGGRSFDEIFANKRKQRALGAQLQALTGQQKEGRLAAQHNNDLTVRQQIAQQQAQTEQQREDADAFQQQFDNGLALDERHYSRGRDVRQDAAAAQSARQKSLYEAQEQERARREGAFKNVDSVNKELASYFGDDAATLVPLFKKAVTLAGGAVSRGGASPDTGRLTPAGIQFLTQHFQRKLPGVLASNKSVWGADDPISDEQLLGVFADVPALKDYFTSK